MPKLTGNLVDIMKGNEKKILVTYFFHTHEVTQNEMGNKYIFIVSSLCGSSRMPLCTNFRSKSLKEVLNM